MSVITGSLIIYQRNCCHQNAVKKVLSKVKNSILRLYDGAKKTLKGNVEIEAKKENKEEDAHLTPHEY